MATSRHAGNQIGHLSWPDLTARAAVEPQDLMHRAWLARARALAESSAAFSAGGPNIQSVCDELAEKISSVLVASCLIRPLGDEAGQLPVAFGHTRSREQPEVSTLLKANPRALVAACSARAAEMRCSILLPDVTLRCLQLWSEPTVWPLLDELGISTLLVAPVHASTRAFGSVVVWREWPAAPLCWDDQVFAEEVARRLAAACV